MASSNSNPFIERPNGAVVFKSGSSFWSPSRLSEMPLVNYLYQSALVVSIVYYREDDAQEEITSFLSDPEKWIYDHFGPFPKVDDDDETRYERPNFIPHKECRVVPNVWTLNHEDPAPSVSII